MKKYIILCLLIVIPASFSCSSSRDVSERRSLMMPKTSENPRNARKYKEVDYSKRNKKQKKAIKKRRPSGSKHKRR
jgi:hypothetical protein